MEFLRESGPDTLINCLSVNFRQWDAKEKRWINNASMEDQREFLAKLMKRCSHSYEKPSMVDRGIQIILNSSAWEMESHEGVYNKVKEKMGLSQEDQTDLGVILNTCMSPWIRSQKTFQRISIIIRNELYNAYGAVRELLTEWSILRPRSDLAFHYVWYIKVPSIRFCVNKPKDTAKGKMSCVFIA